MLLKKTQRGRKLNLEALTQPREQYKKVERVQLNCFLPCILAPPHCKYSRQTDICSPEPSLFFTHISETSYLNMAERLQIFWSNRRARAEGSALILQSGTADRRWTQKGVCRTGNSRLRHQGYHTRASAAELS